MNEMMKDMKNRKRLASTQPVLSGAEGLSLTARALRPRSGRAAIVAAVVFAATNAFAQATVEAPAEDVVEKISVRNRLYTLGGRLELSGHVSFMILNQLTDHINLNIGVGYNIADTLAVELRGGYAISRHTGLARQVSEQLLQRNPTNEVRVTDDLANLWEMNANGIVGIRWQPIYGKLSLLAELPVHFQWYLWAGAGGGTFKRESVVYCTGGVNRGTGECGNGYLRETKVGAVGSAAMGLRFFTHQKGGITLEVRNYLYPDSYLTQIDRTVAERQGDPNAPPTTGTPAQSPGMTALWMFDIGYTFIF